MKLPCFVINLKDSPHKFEKQKLSLLKEGLDPVRFIGVDGRKGEHLYYKEYLTTWCQNTCPKTIMAIAISHVLLAKHIRDLGLSIALVLEDDAYPKTKNLLKHIYEAIQEVPENWDIIKLHCFFPCIKNSITSKGSGAAAYLLSSRGIQKLSEMKIDTHLDLDIIIKNFNIYKSRNNLFWTDESSSLNRETDIEFIKLGKYGFEGEHSLSQCLSYKFLRIPFTSIELTFLHILTLVFIILFLIFK
jgi:GR25 family glycosyltransferase involved in LPS biosynthesis